MARASEISEALAISDTNGSAPDAVLAALEASFDAAWEPLSLTAEGLGFSGELSLYASAMAKETALELQRKREREFARRDNPFPKLPPAIPITVLEAQTQVLDAAESVEHAYSVGGGWSVPLSLTLQRLQTTVRHLRSLNYGPEHEEGYPPKQA